MAAADGEASARAVEHELTGPPPATKITITDADALFASSCPVAVVARTGIAFDAGWEGADKSQWQCAARQQSIGRDFAPWHSAVAGSHHSARVCRVPMSEIASSVVSTLKIVRIDA